MTKVVTQKILLAVFGLLALYGVGLGIRRVVVEAQLSARGEDMPFTLESALHYRRVKMIYDTGSMPTIDQSVEFPDGVNVRTTYEFGSEYVQAALAHLLPDALSVTERLRWIEAGWFCLGVPLMALWVFAWKRSVTGAAVAGLLYAVAVSSVIRSTGQELSKENLALPLLVAHLLARAVALRWAGQPRGRYAIVASSLLLAWSLCWWDMIQYYVLLWAIGGLWSVLVWGETLSSQRSRLWLAEAFGLITVGILQPYYRAHGFILSPSMLMAMAGIVGLLAPGRAGRFRWSLLGILVLAFGAVAFWGSYGAAYGHFTSLVWAKLRFFNVKPADPALLTFDQRIMWVPALDSATIQLTWVLFPAIVALTVVAVVAAFRRARFDQDPEVYRLVLLQIVSLAAFALFVRFHVYVALFGAALAGWWVAEMERSGGWRRWVALSIAGLGIVAESGSLLKDPRAWGRDDVYYSELSELTNWLRARVAPDAVLANFGTSGGIAAYGKCPVVLHPKFEAPGIRKRVREFGELLFRGTEVEFRDWADRHGAKYYVHALGEFATRNPELQMRYFVNALEPATNAPARLFEFAPDELHLFRRMWGNRKYAVYRITTKEDEVAAAQHARNAQAALQRGDLDAAEASAITSLERNPEEARAQGVLRHVMLLREEGFSHEADENRP